MPRFLDCAPEMFRFTKLAAEQDLGLYGAVRSYYDECLDETAEAGIIRIGDNSLPIERECMAMLKAVLKAGCCLIEERAVACRKVFDSCVICPTREEFLPKLKSLSDGDVWIAEIYRAAKEAWA